MQLFQPVNAKPLFDATFRHFCAFNARAWLLSAHFQHQR